MLEFLGLSQNEIYTVDGRGEIVSIGVCFGTVEVRDYSNNNVVANLNEFGETFSFTNERYILKGISNLNQVVIAKFPLI